MLWAAEVLLVGKTLPQPERETQSLVIVAYPPPLRGSQLNATHGLTTKQQCDQSSAPVHSRHMVRSNRHDHGADEKADQAEGFNPADNPDQHQQERQFCGAAMSAGRHRSAGPLRRNKTARPPIRDAAILRTLFVQAAWVVLIRIKDRERYGLKAWIVAWAAAALWPGWQS